MAGVRGRRSIVSEVEREKGNVLLEGDTRQGVVAERTLGDMVRANA